MLRVYEVYIRVQESGPVTTKMPVLRRYYYLYTHTYWYLLYIMRELQ